MSNIVKLGFVFGIFILAVAMFAPTLITAGEADAMETVQLASGDSTGLTDTLSVAADNVSTSGDNATIVFENNRTLATNSTFVNATVNGSVLLSGDTLNVTLSSVDADGAIVTVTYPPTFGWDDGPRAFWENVGLIVAMLAGIMLIGLAALAVRL